MIAVQNCNGDQNNQTVCSNDPHSDDPGDAALGFNITMPPSEFYDATYNLTLSPELSVQFHGELSDTPGWPAHGANGEGTVNLYVYDLTTGAVAGSQSEQVFSESAYGWLKGASIWSTGPRYLNTPLTLTLSAVPGHTYQVWLWAHADSDASVGAYSDGSTADQFLTVFLSGISWQVEAPPVKWTAPPSNRAMRAIGAGPNSQVWGIGTTPWTPGSSDDTINELAYGAWTTKPGGALEVSVAPDTGTPWVVNTAGQVFELVSGEWQLVTSSPPLSSIAAGPQNALWGVSQARVSPRSAQHRIYELVGGSWVLHQGAGVQVTISPDTGTPWMVDAFGAVFEFVSGGWQPVSSSTSPTMSWIAAGPGNVLWGIGTVPWSPGSPDMTIYSSYGANSWTQQPGGAVRISAAPDTGTPWVVNTAGTVFFGGGS
jgi:hypothetical protein